MGTGIPPEECQFEYTASKLMTTELKKAIRNIHHIKWPYQPRARERNDKKSKNSKFQAKYDAIAERCGTFLKELNQQEEKSGLSVGSTHCHSRSMATL